MDLPANGSERSQRVDHDSDGAARQHQSRPDTETGLDEDELRQAFTQRANADAVTPDKDFKRDLRTMLMAAAEREGIGTEPDTDHAQAGAATTPVAAPVRAWWQPRANARVLLVGGLASLTMASAFVAAAARDARPGDTLYGLKKTTESAELAMPSSDIGRGEMYLKFARKRMSEADARRDDEPLLLTLLGSMDDQTRSGVLILTRAAVAHNQTEPLTMLNAFLADQQAAMTRTLEGTTGKARERVAASKRLLDTIQARVDALLARLHCASLSNADELGPKPAACEAPGRVNGPADMPVPVQTVGDVHASEVAALPPAVSIRSKQPTPVTATSRPVSYPAPSKPSAAPTPSPSTTDPTLRSGPAPEGTEPEAPASGSQTTPASPSATQSP